MMGSDWDANPQRQSASTSRCVIDHDRRHFMSQYLAAYDIAEDRRRARVSRLLANYGQRLQRSVFVIQLDHDDLPELRRELGGILAASDSFALVPVDERGFRTTITWQRPLDTACAVRLI
jgi:CRISPR-associated protein Cas2